MSLVLKTKKKKSNHDEEQTTLVDVLGANDNASGNDTEQICR